MLVELETRKSESSGSRSGSIGSGFLWGCWPQIKLCCGSGFKVCFFAGIGKNTNNEKKIE